MPPKSRGKSKRNTKGGNNNKDEDEVLSKKPKSSVVGSVQKDLAKRALQKNEKECQHKKAMAKTTHQKRLMVKEKDVVFVDNEGTVEFSEAELQSLKEQKEKLIKQQKLTQTTSQRRTRLLKSGYIECVHVNSHLGKIFPVTLYHLI